MVRDKQALHGKISEPNRIDHPIRDKFQWLLPDGNSKLTVVGIIAEGIVCPQHVSNGGERLVDHGKRLGIVNVGSGI